MISIPSRAFHLSGFVCVKSYMNVILSGNGGSKFMESKNHWKMKAICQKGTLILEYFQCSWTHGGLR